MWIGPFEFCIKVIYKVLTYLRRHPQAPVRITAKVSASGFGSTVLRNVADGARRRLTPCDWSDIHHVNSLGACLKAPNTFDVDPEAFFSWQVEDGIKGRT